MNDVANARRCCCCEKPITRPLGWPTTWTPDSPAVRLVTALLNGCCSPECLEKKAVADLVAGRGWFQQSRAA